MSGGPDHIGADRLVAGMVDPRPGALGAALAGSRVG